MNHLGTPIRQVRLGNMAAAADHRADGTTILRGPVTDQAQLHGLIARIRDLGATLLSVNVSDADS